MKQNKKGKIIKWLYGKGKHRIVNGGLGVVSIFLAIILVPFATFADYLVESSRYHEANCIMEESMDSAGLSTLSYYDHYLEERFGLMAVSQDIDINKTYTKYVGENLNSLTMWSNVSSTATGDDALSDADVMMEQIFELSKYSGPVGIAGDYVIGELIDLVENIPNVKSILDIFKSTATSADDVVKVTTAVVKVTKKIAKIKTKITAYNSKYTEFKKQAEALAESIGDYNDEVANTQDGDTPPQAPSTSAYTKARSEYATAIGELSDAYSEYKAAVEELQSAVLLGLSNAKATATAYSKKSDSQEVTDLKKQKEDLTTQKNNASEEDKQAIGYQLQAVEARLSALDAEKKSETGVCGAAFDNSLGLYTDLEDILDEYDEAKVTAMTTKLDNLKNTVSSLEVDENTTISDDTYHPSLIALLDAASLEALTQVDLDRDGFGIVKFFKGSMSSMSILTGTSKIYDTKLDAYLSTSSTYKKSDVDYIMEDIVKLIEYAGLVGLTGVVGIAILIVKLKEILEIIIDLVEHVASFAVSFVENAVAIVKETFSKKFGARLILLEYMKKSCSNRTDVTSMGMAGYDEFTGYSFKKVAFCEMNNGAIAATDLGSILKLIKNLSTGGDDMMFCGAELEYILAGTQSEIINQSITFFGMYILKLLTDLPGVLKSGEVKSMGELAGCWNAGIGTAIVYAIEILFNPLVDCLLIVNKKNVSLFNFCVYLTPSGLPTLITSVVSIGLSDTDKQKITENASNIGEIKVDSKAVTKNDKGVCFNYEQLCGVLLLFSGSMKTYTERFSQLVSLERNAYSAKNGEAAFDISKAYTTINATSTGDYNLLLPLDKMSGLGFGSTKVSRARGY